MGRRAFLSVQVGAGEPRDGGLGTRWTSSGTPKTRATVGQLLDRYLDVVDVDPSTLKAYRGYIDRTIRPALGSLPVARIDGEILDTFYGQLRKCRQRCRGRGRHIDHRTAGEHNCDDRCRAHACRPMADSTVRHSHWILSGAFDRAVRWHWISVTPVGSAEPPSPRPNPDPPSPGEAARILDEAWKDPDWGHTSSAGWALDRETLALLDEHMARQHHIAEQLGFQIDADAYLFSLDPDCGRPLVPDTVTQRYDRMARSLGIKTTLHKLRHYKRHRAARRWRRPAHRRRPTRSRQRRSHHPPRLTPPGSTNPARKPPTPWLPAFPLAGAGSNRPARSGAGSVAALRRCPSMTGSSR